MPTIPTNLRARSCKLQIIRRIHTFNILLQALTLFLFCSFQTVIWPYFFGTLVPPTLWLILLFYVILYRSRFEGLLLMYCYIPLILSYSSIHVGVLSGSLVIVYILLTLLKDRLFWPGPQYFLMATIFGFISYHIFYFAVGYFAEPTMPSLLLGSRLLELIMTSLFAIPCYWWLDRLDFLSGRNAALNFDETEVRG